MLDILQDIIYLLIITFLSIQLSSLLINSSFIFNVKKLSRIIFLENRTRNINNFFIRY